MRSLRFLNAILTVITVLLALHLWTWWGAYPQSSPAVAAPRSTPRPGGIPNAGAQRQQQVDLLKRLNQQTDQLIAMFRSGQARVRVEGGQRQDETKQQAEPR